MVLSQRVSVHLSGGHHGHTLFVTKWSRSRCDMFGFSANNNWILMSRQSRPQAQKRNRIQHEFDRDSGAPPKRQHETWRSRTRLFFYDEHLKMMVSQREITEKHISNAVKSQEGNTTAQMCSRNQWLCERDGNSRVHSVIFRSVGLRRTTRHQCTSMSFPLHNGALTKILDACSAPSRSKATITGSESCDRVKGNVQEKK